MSKYECTEERFLKDVAKHQMTVLHDEGVNRHIRFKHPDTRNMSFDFITYPGGLCYTGDMGTFVFERTEDMFRFFRGSKMGGNPGLQINTGYWGEKCVAVDSADGIRQYSPDQFKDVINEWVKEQLEDEEDEEYKSALIEAVQDELLDYADDGEAEVRRLVDGFKFRYPGRDDLEITDFGESTLTVKTGRFIWCCYALVWGIQQYDLALDKTNETTEEFKEAT